MTRYMITTLVSLTLVICLSFLLLFSKSQAKYNQAEKEAVDLVSYDYDVKQVKNFYWSTTDATYFSLDFIDQDLQERYAIIPQEGGEVRYFDREEFITQEQAQEIAANDYQPVKFLETRLSLLNHEPVWEVTIKNDNNTITYYYLNAYNGEWVKKIENV